MRLIKKNEKQNKSYASLSEVHGSKRAVLRYKLVASSERYHLIEVELETGRHHQIRCQLAMIGCVIKGDVKYGGKRTNKDGGIHLLSIQIEFLHPTTLEPIKITANPIKDPLWNELFQISKYANIDL